VVVPGNSSCEDLGYDFGFKPQPEPPPSGTYIFPDGINTLTITSDGTEFDWNSTLGLDAVIVKGGPDANIYYYDPESFVDDGLHSPINPNNNSPYGLSHIEVCYDYELDVSKTATTTFTRTFNWDISKSVSPDKWDLFTGDDGTSQYTVAVTKTGFSDSEWAVSGNILIENNTPLDATIESITDVISGVGPVVTDCSFPFLLPAGGSITCTYSSALPDGTDRINTATVETSGAVGGGESTADVSFGAPTTLVNAEINVSDSNGKSWGPVSDDMSWTYDRTFTCDGDKGIHDNTATIDETGQSDDATVTVNCYELTVAKNASTELTRTWDWTIDKSADETSLTLATGEQYLVTYWIEVSATSTDSDWGVSGSITIANPNPTRDADLTGVSDLVDPDIEATVTCPASAVPKGGSLVCTYEADLPDDANRTNTATATRQNYSYKSDGTATASGTTDISGTAAVDFSSATLNKVDECIAVSDTHIGSLGTVCADEAPAMFEYPRYIGPYEECGNYEVPNTASFVTNDTKTEGSDSWTVDVNVPCDGGCTLTQGYWKTHSMYGPAPYDDTWAQIGEDSPFFESGKTYHEVLWTPSDEGAYYILAHQYIAAELNKLNGASVPPDVQDAFDAATVLFEAFYPGEIKGKIRKDAIEYATILDDYNNGIIGPGHCDEDKSAEAEATSYTKGAAVQQSLGPEIDDIILEAYPNPFSDELNFHIVLPYESKMVLEIYNLVGQKIAVLHDNEVEAGQVIDVRVNASELPKQTLIYRMSTSEEVLTGKLLPIQR
jgi:hypothetical protein